MQAETNCNFHCYLLKLGDGFMTHPACPKVLKWPSTSPQDRQTLSTPLYVFISVLLRKVTSVHSNVLWCILVHISLIPRHIFAQVSFKRRAAPGHSHYRPLGQPARGGDNYELQSNFCMLSCGLMHIMPKVMVHHLTPPSLNMLNDQSLSFHQKSLGTLCGQGFIG